MAKKKRAKATKSPTRPKKKVAARKTARKTAAQPKKRAPKKVVRAKPTAATAQPQQQAPPPPPPGSFVWHELMTTDVARSKEFYKQMFGWKSSEMEMMPDFM